MSHLWGRVATLFVILMICVIAGCSKQHAVLVINRFPQDIVVKLDGKAMTPEVPANGHVIFSDRKYIGGAVRISIVTRSGKRLKEIDLLGDDIKRNQFKDDLLIIDVSP